MDPSQISVRLLLAAGSPLVAGLIAAVLAIRLAQTSPMAATTTRKAYTDLWRPYLWACSVFAFGAIISGVIRMQVSEPTEIVTTAFALTTFSFALPWTVFALNYVGREHLLTTRRIHFAIIYVGAIILAGVLDLQPVRSVLGPFPNIAVITAILVLGVAVVVFAASGLVLLSTFRHSTLTTSHGFFASLPLLTLLFSLQFATSIEASAILDSILIVAWLITAGGLVAATTHYHVLTLRPGTGTSGERAAIREMSEAIVTVGQNETLARANSAARELFGADLDDQSFPEIIGHDLSTLEDREMVECWTADGRKQFDPRVTELVNDYDEVFGYTIILIDITEREIRRQRIEVLNRILRHNLRNSLDIIKADAELVTDSERADSLLSTTDRLEQLTKDVRRIESLLRRHPDERPTGEIYTIVTSVTSEIAAEYPAASITVDFPDLSVSVHSELFRFALQNVVENAIVHNDSPEPRVDIHGSRTEAGAKIIITDDGPGIPESERAVIERRSESQLSHASSLGLWGINWAIQQLGGEISFTESELGGTAVVIQISEIK